MEQTNTPNSLLPLGVTNAIKNIGENVMRNTSKLANNLPKLPNLPNMPNVSSVPSIPILGILLFVTVVAVIVVVIRYFSNEIRDGYDKVVQNVRSALGYPSNPPAPVETTTPTTAPPDTLENPEPSQSVVEKILPQNGNAQVFNVSKNVFTYYDAEPLCRALGAELATYEQVKSAWERGADWCNYGWVKGQMAVYPTQKETWEKLQAGPEEQRMACGQPGINGGFFDNPELRYGVNCFGAKPSQSSHDATEVAKGTPQSPSEVEFDKKVAKFRSQADHIGVMPFNTNKWSQ